MTAPVLTLRAVGVRYDTPAGPLQVLSGIDLVVAPGEVLAVVGPSGCGKTTLLRAIQGLQPVDSGSISFRAADARTGYVFQRASLYPWWNVRRNVEFGLRLRRARRSRAGRSREDAKRILALVGLAGFEDFRPAALSGGMQQRVNLARALVVEPDVLLLDEPFSALDALTREHLQRVLRSTLDALGTAAIIVTHDIREAVFLGDRIAVMGARPGRIVGEHVIDHGRRDEVFQHGEALAAYARDVYDHLSATSQTAAVTVAASSSTAGRPGLAAAR